MIQTLLFFVAGINTLLQSFLGTRLPAVIGGSYTFVAPTISIILAGRYNGIADPHEVALLSYAAFSFTNFNAPVDGEAASTKEEEEAAERRSGGGGTQRRLVGEPRTARGDVI